jgi:DNA-binding NtrC family response regulator
MSSLTSLSPHLPFQGLGSEDALRRVADVLPDALFTIDLEGRVTYWNKAAERITGWSSAEALGRDCSIMAGDALRGCACGVGPIKCGLVDQGRTAKTCTLRAKDGRLLDIVKNAVPLWAPDGSPVGALETFTLVGEQGAEPRCAWTPDVQPPPASCGMVGRHPVMLDLYRTIEQVARSSATVMILGESGSGKECVAGAIHQGSKRAEGPFVRVSCSALNENLLESELFGHVKGAFTGALRDRRGRFQDADGGTLLLDEIGDISPMVQLKLLRVIEQREIERVGDSAPIRVDVRLLCATHRDLKAMVEQGRFRADLYFRLAVFPLRVPPLREHVEDLPLIADAWMEKHAAINGDRPSGISSAALERLQAYSWPGNVRELQNVLEFAILRAGGETIDESHLPEEVLRPARARPASPTVTVISPARDRGLPLDRDEVLAVLEAAGGNRAEAARRLGISRVTLWKRLKEYGLVAAQDQPPE